MSAPADILVIDPPWKFASNSEARPGRNAMRHYSCMTDQELALLPVSDWLKKDALAFIWVTAPMLYRAMKVIDTWQAGLRYVSQLVWEKDRIGTGFWVRNRHEPVLIYRRGKFPCPRPAPFSDSIITGNQREHSRKPPALQDSIDAQWPDAVKMEAFARCDRPGWISWGDEVGRFAA